MWCNLAGAGGHDTFRTVRDLLVLAIHLVVTFAKLLRLVGVRAIGAESLALKHQVLISNRFRHRAPNLTARDRLILGLITLFVNPRRIPKLGALVKPATLFKFHKALVERKYRRLFSSSAWPRHLFRCESILLRSHWVLVVLDLFTRRIVGFGVERAIKNC